MARSHALAKNAPIIMLLLCRLHDQLYDTDLSLSCLIYVYNIYSMRSILQRSNTTGVNRHRPYSNLYGNFLHAYLLPNGRI